MNIFDEGMITSRTMFKYSLQYKTCSDKYICDHIPHVMCACQLVVSNVLEVMSIPNYGTCLNRKAQTFDATIPTASKKRLIELDPQIISFKLRSSLLVE